MRQTGLNYSQIDNYINDQVRKGNQVLVEGNSVKVYNGKTTVKVSGFSNDILTVPATTPVPVKTKKTRPRAWPFISLCFVVKESPW